MDEIKGGRWAKTSDYVKGIQCLGYSLRMNEMDASIQVTKDNVTRELDDGILAKIKNGLRDLELEHEGRIRDTMTQVAYTNQFHPVRDYLTGLTGKHDGIDHIGQFVDNYLCFERDIEASGFAKIAFKRWLVGCVSKVLYQTQNPVFVWAGNQGLGKSTLARWLCPDALQDYFNEGQVNPADKDDMIRLCGSFLWEIPEIQATTRRSDQSALKDFFTKQVVRVRRSYARMDIKKPALASFIATFNEDNAGFLRDTTGNRRYLTIQIDGIDHAYAQLDVNRMWTQAVNMLEVDKRSYRLNEAEKEQQEAVNSRYIAQTAVGLMFEECFTVDKAGGVFMTTVEIYEELERRGLKGSQNNNLNELARHLSSYGLSKSRPRKDNPQRKVGYTGLVLRDTVGTIKP